MEINKAMGSPLLDQIEKLRIGEQKIPVNKKESVNSNDFQNDLKDKLDSMPTKQEDPGLKISAHAQKRMHSRDIQLSPDDFLKMQEAVQRARDKGSKESLILTDKAAFVVSVKNNTVITAVDKNSLKENVFTNIDSTIMI